jgi:hypothetical protein
MIAARLVLSMIFVGSFLLRPLLMRPINLVWRRIVESDKPVFTPTFGGVAALGAAISEAAKHLEGRRLFRPQHAANAIPHEPYCFRYALVRFKRTPFESTFLPSLRIWGLGVRLPRARHRLSWALHNNSVNSTPFL